MSVDARTHALLALADENRSLAYRLFADEDPSLRWVSVIAFYSAVHYIGAYFWAHDRQVISSHAERDIEVHNDIELRRIAPNYLRLFGYGFDARYKAYYKADHATVEHLLRVDLAAIESCVKRHLPE